MWSSSEAQGGYLRSGYLPFQQTRSRLACQDLGWAAVSSALLPFMKTPHGHHSHVANSRGWKSNPAPWLEASFTQPWSDQVGKGGGSAGVQNQSLGCEKHIDRGSWGREFDPAGASPGRGEGLTEQQRGLKLTLCLRTSLSHSGRSFANTLEIMGSRNEETGLGRAEPGRHHQARDWLSGKHGGGHCGEVWGLCGEMGVH